MKEIFLALMAQLKTVPQLKWIDLEKGQMNSPQRPSVAFPAALITITIPRSQNIHKKLQDCNAQITVRLCFDYTGNTNQKTPELTLAKSLEYFDIVDGTYNKLQGFQTENFNSLEHINTLEEVRPDDYKVMQMTFNSTFRRSVD